MQRLSPFGVQAGPAKVLEFPQPHAKRLLVPREHGSWGMWLLPGISGAVVGFASATGQSSLAALWLFVAAFSAFLVYQPVEALFGQSLLKARSPREKHILLFWISALAALAAWSTYELFRLGRGRVLLFGVVALGCFSLHALLGLGRSVRSLRQIIASFALTSTAAAAYYVITGRIDRVAYLLWLATWLFAAAQIEYVQLRMRTASAKSRAAKLKAGWDIYLLYLALVAAAIATALAHLVPLLLAFAFIPAATRIVFWAVRAPQRLDVIALGFSELFQSLLFSSLLTIAFLFRR